MKHITIGLGTAAALILFPLSERAAGPAAEPGSSVAVNPRSGDIEFAFDAPWKVKNEGEF